MNPQALGLRVVVYGLLGASLALGLPLFHYITAVLISLALRHGKGKDGLLLPLLGRTAAIKP